MAALFKVNLQPLLITKALAALAIFKEMVIPAVAEVNVTVVVVPVMFKDLSPAMDVAIAVTFIAPPAPVALLASKNTSPAATGTAPFPPPTAAEEVVFQLVATFHAPLAPPTQK